MKSDTTKPYRPVPGKFTVELVNNRIVKVAKYGNDISGEYVEVKLAGSYHATIRLPLTCIRQLTEVERRHLSALVDSGFF